MQDSRDPHTPDVVRSDAARVLSVSEASDYIFDNYGVRMSERHTRRRLSSGIWPCTRTAKGHLGITVGDLTAIWTPWEPADRGGAQ